MAEWRTIPSYPDYEASDEGEIRRRTPYPPGRQVRPLKPHLNNAGYHYASPGEGSHVGVHVMICEAFHGPKPSSVHQVAHADGQKLNNTPNNLRWALPKENTADRKLHGTYFVGEAIPTAKLNENQVLEIRSKRGFPTIKLSREYGVTRENINCILRRDTWRHLA